MMQEGRSLVLTGETNQVATNNQLAELQHQMEEVEVQAQAELDAMHTELLSLRQQCHELQLNLNESEAKR